MNSNANPSVGHRQISPDGLSLLKHFEQGPHGGFASTPYLDDAGHRTIGWGHKIKPYEVFFGNLDEEQADALLRDDLAVAEVYVDALRGVAPKMHQFDALVMFAFNLGLGALEKSTLLKRVRAGASMDEVAAQWMRWVYIRNPWRQADGLKRRRVVEFLHYAGRPMQTILDVNEHLMVVARKGDIGPRDIQQAIEVV